MEIRKLKKTDTRRAFRSGVEPLDVFFHKYAGQNQFRHHIGVTYVAIEENVILGYVTVSSAHLEAEDDPPARRLPRYPLPVLRIARLATAASHRGRGVGGALLGFCVKLAVQMREDFGCVGLITDAKDESAVAFYAKHDFVALDRPATSSTTPMFLGLTTAVK